MKNLFLVLAASALLAVGCSTKIKSTPAGGSAATLERGQKILIAIPADGTYAGTSYANSGREAADRLKAALASQASVVMDSQAKADVQAAIKEGQVGGYRYVVHPEITHWEPRAAAWSGLPTRVVFFVTVYDLKAQGKPILQRDLNARGRIWTFKSQYPADIATVMFSQFADEVF